VPVTATTYPEMRIHIDSHSLQKFILTTLKEWFSSHNASIVNQYGNITNIFLHLIGSAMHLNVVTEMKYFNVYTG
jgi:hypothetical protein